MATTELFTIRLHYKVGDIEGLARYIDYCCADQVSQLELISMAKEFKLNVEGSSIWWLDVTSGEKGYKEVKTDIDALSMALSVRSNKEICVCVNLPSDASALDHEDRVRDCNDEAVGVDQFSRVELLKYVKE